MLRPNGSRPLTVFTSQQLYGRDEPELLARKTEKEMEANMQEIEIPKKAEQKPRIAAEQQLFDFTGGWDQFDTAGFTFYEVTTTVPIGTLPTGRKFDYANVDYENSRVEFGNTAGETYTFNLILTVGERL
jgi:hypothetical protein